MPVYSCSAPGQYSYMVVRPVARCLPWYRQRHPDYCGTRGQQLRRNYRTLCCGTVCQLVKRFPLVVQRSLDLSLWYSVLYRHASSLVDTVYFTVASPTTTGWLCFRLSLPAHSYQAPKHIATKTASHQNRYPPKQLSTKTAIHQNSLLARTFFNLGYSA